MELQGKALLTAINVFLGNNIGATVLVLSFSLIVFVALLVVNYYIQPCRGKGATANNMRTAEFCGCVFGTVCAIASYALNNVRSGPGQLAGGATGCERTGRDGTRENGTGKGQERDRKGTGKGRDRDGTGIVSSNQDRERPVNK